jgi:hypothetical protein
MNFNEAATKQPEPVKEVKRGKDTDEGGGESAAGSAQEAARIRNRDSAAQAYSGTR